jgi:sugar/nucleoside kinase (ribokinase family)
MSRVLVSGVVNVETTVRVDAFPVTYSPARYPLHGVASAVSGVGYNVAKALTMLGDEVRLCSLVGRDLAGGLVIEALARAAIQTSDVLPRLDRTPQSAILYDGDGRRQVNVDLKDVQERGYPVGRFDRALRGCHAAVLCNVNFSRPFLSRALRAGVPIVTDVHAISRLDDEYNAEFMQAASVLFLSGESLACPPEDWAREALSRFGSDVVVVGLGAAGAVLALRSEGSIERFAAAPATRIVSTVGAGDALLAAFVHGYTANADPREALRQAMVFAAHKIGAAGGADGFLTERARRRREPGGRDRVLTGGD